MAPFTGHPEKTFKASCSTHGDDRIIAVVGVIGGVVLPELALDPLLREDGLEQASNPKREVLTWWMKERGKVRLDIVASILAAEVPVSSIPSLSSPGAV